MKTQRTILSSAEFAYFQLGMKSPDRKDALMGGIGCDQDFVWRGERSRVKLIHSAGNDSGPETGAFPWNASSGMGVHRLERVGV